MLKQLLPNQTGHLLLEFNIPRMGLRADAVLLLPGCVVILEFKLGEQHATPAARSRVCCLSTAELILDEARKVGFEIPAALNWTA